MPQDEAPSLNGVPQDRQIISVSATPSGTIVCRPMACAGAPQAPQKRLPGLSGAWQEEHSA